MIAPAFVTANRLRILLQGLVDVPLEQDREISGVQLDSRQLRPGEVFLALPGTQADGIEFAGLAIEQGAAAVIYETPIEEQALLARAAEAGVPLIRLQGLAQRASEIAARYYGHPSRQLGVVGVTGTDGKTSVSHFIAQALRELGKQVAVIGTIGNGALDSLSSASHTTPDAVGVQAMLNGFRHEYLNHVVMEASSHGLHQGRVNAVEFNVAVLTNLGRDHMDYHKSMEAYADAKRSLFYSKGLQAAVLNCDDDFGCILALELEERLPVYGYGFSVDMYPNMVARVLGSDLVLHDKGLHFNVSSGGQTFSVNSPLLGRFNASNLLATIATLLALGVPLSEAVEIVHRLAPVPGRMQLIKAAHAPAVVIDYAHTPQALALALGSLREHVKGKLYCVFGCGGDRDKGKRALMGRIAEERADAVIVTDDNPRSEKPEAIVANICEGMHEPEKAVIVHDRQQAIYRALDQAEPGDVVLVAGKGHEDYQVIGEQRLSFSDLTVVEAYLGQEVPS